METLSAAHVPAKPACAGCGTELPPSKGGRPRKWCSEKCRKRKYDLVCAACGGRVNGTSPGKIGPDGPRCGSCATDARRIWTADAILLAIETWADENGGVPPTAPQWLRNRPNGVPAVQTIQGVFGSWNAALAAAGFETRQSGHYGREGEDPEIRRKTVELYRSGLSLAEVGEIMGVYPATIRHRLIVENEPRRPRNGDGGGVM